MILNENSPFFKSDKELREQNHYRSRMMSCFEDGVYMKLKNIADKYSSSAENNPESKKMFFYVHNLMEKIQNRKMNKGTYELLQHFFEKSINLDNLIRISSPSCNP